MKVVRLDTQYYLAGSFGHFCPGCNSGHEISVEAKNHSGAQWTFNGDCERPTFAPSINLKINPPGHEHYQPDVKSSVCHYFIRDGKIQFLGDCTHDLRGQTVDLPDLPTGLYLTSQRAAQKGA